MRNEKTTSTEGTLDKLFNQEKGEVNNLVNEITAYLIYAYLLYKFVYGSGEKPVEATDHKPGYEVPQLEGGGKPQGKSISRNTETSHVLESGFEKHIQATVVRPIVDAIRMKDGNEALAIKALVGIVLGQEDFVRRNGFNVKAVVNLAVGISQEKLEEAFRATLGVLKKSVSRLETKADTKDALANAYNEYAEAHNPEAVREQIDKRATFRALMDSLLEATRAQPSQATSAMKMALEIFKTHNLMPFDVQEEETRGQSNDDTSATPPSTANVAA